MLCNKFECTSLYIFIYFKLKNERRCGTVIVKQSVYNVGIMIDRFVVIVCMTSTRYSKNVFFLKKIDLRVSSHENSNMPAYKNGFQLLLFTTNTYFNNCCVSSSDTSLGKSIKFVFVG